MAGKIDLRDNCNASFGCISDDIAKLLLGIETAIALSIGLIAAEDLGAVSICSDLGELGILLDFDSPALVLGEMPVETVHFVDCHEVEDLLDFLDGEEVAAAVEEESSVFKTRAVHYADKRKRPVALRLC